MRNLIIFCFLSLSITAFGQKYITKTGTIDFEASVPAFEPVKAKHSTTTAVLDLSNGNLAVLALVKGFRFKNALMEEHFNENYMDSDTYPKTTFTGTIIDFNADDIGAKQEYTVKGTLTIHGKEKEIEAPISLSKNGDTIILETTFTTAPGDFDIKIPNVVKEKISESIVVTGNFELAQRK